MGTAGRICGPFGKAPQSVVAGLDPATSLPCAARCEAEEVGCRVRPGNDAAGFGHGFDEVRAAGSPITAGLPSPLPWGEVGPQESR